MPPFAKPSGRFHAATSRRTPRWQRQPDIRSTTDRWCRCCANPAIPFPGSASLARAATSGLPREAALEQRTRLEMEGVKFRGKRIVMEEHQHAFRTWEFE